MGRVTLGDTISYELRDGRIDRVDVAALAGDTTSAPLSGRFTLTGRGTAPAEAQDDGGASTWTSYATASDGSSGWTRPSGWIVVTCASTGEGALQGGRLVLEALGRPFDSTASYVLRRAALERVDLGTLLGLPEFAGPVTLSVTGEARIRGEHAVGAGARLTVEPSRLGRVKVSAAANDRPARRSSG